MAEVPKGHMKTPEPEDMWIMAKKQAEIIGVLIQALLLR